MRRRITILYLAFIYPLLANSQIISLNHTNTLYDASENPVQSSFIANQSRQKHISILPHLSGYLNFKGEAHNAFKNLIFNRKFIGSNLEGVGIDQGNLNQITFGSNTYIFNYRILKSLRYKKELGVSLQFRADGNSKITNESFAILTSMGNFNKNYYDNVLTNRFTSQTYWQLGVSYRENYDDHLAFGGKFSILSGATFNSLRTEYTNLEITGQNSYESAMKGKYISSFGTDSLEIKHFMPNLKNLGVSANLGASYLTNDNMYLTASLQDLGFIRWGKETNTYSFNDTLYVNQNNSFFSEFGDIVNNSNSEKPYYSLLNTRIELALSKDFGTYKPVLVLSKNAFNQEGQLAIINNLKQGAFNFSLTPIYNLTSKWNLGTQLMIKSANAEFYLGSENLANTIKFSKAFLKSDKDLHQESPRSSMYLGMAIKFGKKIQDIGNADDIDGLNDQETGFVMRLSKRDKKSLQKKNKDISKRRKKNDKRNRQ